MFDVGWSELVVIGVVALVVIGPKELPGVIRSVGRAVGKLRTMAGEFRAQFDDAMREAELHEVKKTFDDAASSATSAVNEATKPFDEVKSEFDASAASIREDAAGPTASEKISAIEADAKAMEAEIAAESAPAPKPRARKKKAGTAGDEAGNDA
ncbi:MAG TPA: Sec-independent protein translocase protein TatB [Rhabdaerophilum sp.]|nr:Sec-independent protein translocase protein TatB [Rhabdaerophilum sp.]